jgi:hypothetical protein
VDERSLSALDENRCMNMNVWEVQLLVSDDGDSNIEKRLRIMIMCDVRIVSTGVGPFLVAEDE